MMRRPGAWLALVLAAGCGGPEQLGPDVAGSPSDGLVFVRVGGEGRLDLWRARLADGATRPFIVTQERRETWPVWSQAAGLLVFETSPEGQRRKTLRLWRARDGVELPLPVQHAGGLGWPHWGPRGEQLAYAVGPHADTSGGLAVLDLASERSRFWAVNRSGLDFVRPAFAPDGERLVAQGTDAEGARVYRLEPGASPRAITPREQYAHRAEFDRTGAWVVFSVVGPEGQPDHIAAVRPDGTDLQRLGDAAGAQDARVKASPARDELAFVSDREGGLDVFLMEFSGGRPRSLTANLELDAGPLSWSPDGERIAVVVEPPGTSAAGRPSPPETWEIVVLDRDGRELFRTPGFSPDWMPPWP